MSAMLTATKVKRLGRTAGFDLVGIARAEPLEDFERYCAWLDRGFHGDMAYLEQGAEARRDPRSLLPKAQSVVVCGLNYLTPHPFRIPQESGDQPVISRHAWGRDYHVVVRRRLKRLLRLIEEHVGRAVRARLCVDTAPLLERALAARAGLGWIGKNNCLIHPVFGSFLFLGELVLDIELMPDEPIGNRCGRCARCLSACPTQALAAPHLLDARRCIAYLTIEHRGPIESGLALRMGARVYGCDACQEVCPWNRRAQQRLATNVREFWPASHLANVQFGVFIFENESEFRCFFTGGPIRRLRWETWQRNLVIAFQNARRTGRMPQG